MYPFFIIKKFKWNNTFNYPKNVIPETIIIALFTDEIFSKIKIKFSKLFKFNYVIGSVYISKKSSRIYINGFD